jgi:hypothetical protein
VTGARHELIPEVTSLPLQSILTGALCHPFPLGSGVGLPSVVGGVASYLTSSASEELFPALSVQLPLMLVPAVSGPL